MPSSPVSLLISSDSAGLERADSGMPLYARIAQVLTAALAQGRIPAGAVLLEGPLADILSVTRTPVRQALQMLEAQGVLNRFEGRGLIAGPVGTVPRRMVLTAQMLGLEAEEAAVRKARGWETIYQEVERDVVHLSVFDACRLNELELARHFNVGRMAARDVLQRLENLGLLTKDERQRWSVIPLDQQRIGHLYELRGLLEPAALESAAARIPQPELEAIRTRLQQAIAAYPSLSRQEMDGMENDLHVILLSYCENKPLLDSLQRTRSILTLSKHVLGAAAPMPASDPFLADHLAVIEPLRQHKVKAARRALVDHLDTACIKVMQRAEFVRTHMSRPDVPYVMS